MYESEFTPDDAIGLGILVGIGLAILAIFLIVRIFFLLTCKKALTRCSEENRTMSPGLVWLALIPGFHYIWDFFVVINLGDSLDKEFKKRGINTEPYPGKSIGLAYCITDACFFIPVLNVLTGLAGFVCWIIYWIKIAGFSKQLAAPFSPPAVAGPQQAVGNVSASSVAPVAPSQQASNPVAATSEPQQTSSPVGASAVPVTPAAPQQAPGAVSAPAAPELQQTADAQTSGSESAPE